MFEIGCDRLKDVLDVIITSNDRSFGYPIIYTDTIHNVVLFIAHSLIGKPYLAIIASKGHFCMLWHKLVLGFSTFYSSLVQQSKFNEARAFLVLTIIISVIV